MKLHVLLFTVFSITSASRDATCEDCIAVVNTLATFLTSEESLANQIDVLLAEVCPMDEEPEVCVAELPAFWAKIAAVLWPGYFDAEAEWMCGSEENCGEPPMTCEECTQGINGAIDQLLLPSTIEGIVMALSGDAFCGQDNDPQTCEAVIEFLIPVALPALAETGGRDPARMAEICNAAVPDTCPAIEIK